MRREQTLADRITSSSVWRSVVRHGYPDNQRNQALIIAFIAAPALIRAIWRVKEPEGTGQVLATGWG